MKAKKGKEKFSKFSDEDILLTMGVLTKIENKIFPTVAGIMVLGLYPQKFFPQWFIAAMLFPGFKVAELGTDGQRFDDNKKIDGNFPVHPPDSSKAEYLTALSQTVVKEKADLGVAFDGDADRLGVITSDGNFLQTDHLLQIFAEDILKKNPDAVFIADIKTGKTFISEIKRMGGRPLIWKTGHSFIKKKMKETNALLGGEVSGHICFADKYFGFDDALYSAVRLLNIVANQKEESFLERIQRIPKTVISPEMEIFCPDDQKFQCVEKIKKILQDQQLSFDETDGIKYIYPSTGWWLLRASNTSERLICRCEADTVEEMEQLKKDLFHLLNTVYPVDLK